MLGVQIAAFPKSLGIRRGRMPQIRRPDVPAFLAALRADGIAVRKGRRSVDSLLPTQARYDADKARSLLTVAKLISNKPLIVSADGYILDGHHRYAALKMTDNPMVNTIEIDLPIRRLINRARHWHGAKFVQTAGLGESTALLKAKVINWLYREGYTRSDAARWVEADTEVIQAFARIPTADFKPTYVAAAAQKIYRDRRRGNPVSERKRPQSRHKTRKLSPAWVEKYLPEYWNANTQSKTTGRLCAASTVLGFDNPNLPALRFRGQRVTAKEYEVCLTTNQAKRLFSSGTRVTEKYGAGTFAGVWKKGDKDVLKVTKDAEDVGALLLTGSLKHVRRISKAYELVGAGHDLDGDAPTPVFAIVSEDVKPVEDDPDVSYGEWANRWWRGWLGTDGPMPLLRAYADKYVYNGKAPAKFAIPRDIRKKFYRRCMGNIQTGPRGCQTFTREFMDTWTKMARKGVIAWDMHSGNFGVSMGKRTKAGTWMIIDAGLSSREPPPEKVQELRAAWRTAHRKTIARRHMVFVGAATTALLIAPMIVQHLRK